MRTCRRMCVRMQYTSQPIRMSVRMQFHIPAHAPSTVDHPRCRDRLGTGFHIHLHPTTAALPPAVAASNTTTCCSNRFSVPWHKHLLQLLALLRMLLLQIHALTLPAAIPSLPSRGRGRRFCREFKTSCLGVFVLFFKMKFCRSLNFCQQAALVHHSTLFSPGVGL